MKLRKTQTQPFILGAALALGVATPLYAAAQTGAALPEEPVHGSMRVDADSETKLAKLATVDVARAIEAANAHTPGRITGAELEVENQFLVWEVTSVAEDGTETELYVDAGTAEVLAMEREKHEGIEGEDSEGDGEESE